MLVLTWCAEGGSRGVEIEGWIFLFAPGQQMFPAPSIFDANRQSTAPIVCADETSRAWYLDRFNFPFIRNGHDTLGHLPMYLCSISLPG